jgi:hypothetical protein
MRIPTALLRAAARVLPLLTAVVLVARPATVTAQSSGLEPVPVGYSRLVSINPLLLVFVGTISADFEQRVAPSVTMGASGASFDLSDANYLTLDAKARYYLSGRAFDGFSISASLGVARMKADSSRTSASALSVGFGAERQWLVGPEERLTLAIGASAARLFGAPDSDEFRTVLPGLRLSLGWGF